MPALSLDHWNIYCKDLKATVDFYEKYVGLYAGDRPPFSFPGAWLYAGEKPILHLVSETGHEAHGSGAIDHVAINCADIRGTIDRIKADNVPFEVRKVPARPLQQEKEHSDTDCRHDEPVQRALQGEQVCDRSSEEKPNQRKGDQVDDRE